ncbi:MAG: DMT family transporter [Actinomycetota bacterium]
MRSSYWFLLLVAGIGWGTGGIATRAAFAEGLGPWTIIGMRVPIAAVLVVGLLVIRRLPSPTRHDLRIGTTQAIVNLVAPFALVTFAVKFASAGFVGVLVALVPLATAVFAHFLLPDEPLTRMKLLALSVSFAGVGFLMLSGDSGLASDGQPMLAIVLTLIGVLFIGYAGTHAKKHAGTYDPMMLTGIQFALGGAILIIAMVMVEGVPADVSSMGWMLIIYMAVIGTVTPFLIYFWLLQHISVTNASLVGYIVPFVGLTGGIVLLGEQLQMGIAVGGTLILAGMMLSDREARRTEAVVVASEA